MDFLVPAIMFLTFAFAALAWRQSVATRKAQEQWMQRVTYKLDEIEKQLGSVGTRVDLIFMQDKRSS